MKHSRLACVGPAIVFSVGVVALAGPVDPPPGPVAATGPTMILSIPYTISTPGSYRLARNVTWPGGNGTGITITASDVSLDLAGFTLDGTGSFIHAAGIVGGTRLTVSNGTVRGWQGTGIAATDSLHLFNVRLDGNGNSQSTDSYALSAGTNVQMFDCTMIGSGARYLATLGQGAQVERCTVLASGDGPGFVVGDYSSVVDTSIRDVGGYMGPSAFGISTGMECKLTRCTVKTNGSSNTLVRLGQGSTATECTVIIPAGDGNTAIVAAADCHIVGCTILASGPYVGALTKGIDAGSSGVVIRDCKITVSGNDSIAVLAPTAGEIRGCVVFGAGTGISAGGAGTVIDGNTVTGCTILGYSITGTGNLLVRNNARGNTIDYSIGVGNSYGPIINSTAGGDLSLVPAASHPQANFRY